jgi:colanic acid/amylovoran biosynthesis glycosyltransferase
MIAYLVSQYPAPSHTFIRREVAALRKHGIHVETHSVRPGESLSEADRSEEARTFVLQRESPLALGSALLTTLARRPGRWLSTLAATLRLRPRGAVALAKASAHFVEAMRLAAELERRGATHVHSHFANSASRIGLAASRYLGIGWSVTLHGLSDFGGPATELLREQVRASTFVVSATQYGIAQAMRLSDPADWHKLHLVRCGVDAASRPEPRREPLRAGQRVRFLSVGRLAPEKAHTGLLSALARVVADGVDAELTLIGGGPEEGRIRAAVSTLGLTERVVLRGAQPEPAVLRAMGEADVFVLSSLSEGLPVVLMEALAAKLPVVAPLLHGIPELVQHERTGLLYTVGRWDELADRMRALAVDAAMRERLGTAGRRRVLEEFDAEAAALPLSRLLSQRDRAWRGAPSAAPRRAGGAP